MKVVDEGHCKGSRNFPSKTLWRAHIRFPLLGIDQGAKRGTGVPDRQDRGTPSLSTQSLRNMGLKSGPGV